MAGMVLKSLVPRRELATGRWPKPSSSLEEVTRASTVNFVNVSKGVGSAFLHQESSEGESRTLGWFSRTTWWPGKLCPDAWLRTEQRVEERKPGEPQRSSTSVS